MKPASRMFQIDYGVAEIDNAMYFDRSFGLIDSFLRICTFSYPNHFPVMSIRASPGCTRLGKLCYLQVNHS